MTGYFRFSLMGGRSNGSGTPTYTYTKLFTRTFTPTKKIIILQHETKTNQDRPGSNSSVPQHHQKLPQDEVYEKLP